MTFKETIKKLKGVFTDSPDLIDGIDKVSSYLSIFAVASASTGIEPLTAVGFASLVAKGTVGLTKLIKVVTASGDKIVEPYIRFDIEFSLLAHKAYAEALNDALSTETIALRMTVKNTVAIEDASVSWNSELRPDFLCIELFSQYGKALEDFLSKEHIDAIGKDAQERLFNALKNAEQGQWIYNYMQFAELIQTRTALDNLQEQVKLALKGFVVSEAIARDEADWTAYRAYLKDLPNDKIFGSNFGIEKIYVLPRYHYYRSGTLKNKDIAKETPLPLRDNLHIHLSHLISTRIRRDNLTFILGDPGVGKTSLTRMYGSYLAEMPEMHPVVIPLKHLDPDKDLTDEIEEYLRRSSLAEAVDNLYHKSNLVIILDAFDELAKITKDRMLHFFRKLEQFARHGKYLNASLIVTGRHTLFDRDDPIIPAGSHVIMLEPFDKAEIKEWCDKWNAVTSQNFDGLKFWMDDTETDIRRRNLHELARQPLLLYLLAVLERDSVPIDPKEAAISPASVYRHIVVWSMKRHAELRDQGDGNTICANDLRQALRIAGFLTFSTNKREVDIEDLQKELEKIGILLDGVIKKREAEQTFLAMAFDKASASTWEFKHKSFGEYFAAEYIAEHLYKCLSKQINEAGQDEYILNDGAVAEIWAELFGKSLLTREIQSFLEPMLGDWFSFIKGKEVDRSDGLKLIMERAGSMYKRFVHETDMGHMTKLAKEARTEPTRCLAHFGMSALFLGSYASRILSKDGEPPVLFNLEEYAPDRWWLMESAIRRHYPVYGDIYLAQRLFEGVSLNRTGGIIFPSAHYPGLMLPFVVIKSVRKSSFDDIQGFDAIQDIDGIGRPINLTGASLFAAVFADVNLEKSDLERADLERADLRGAYLGGANLRRANLQEVALNGANLMGAIIQGGNLQGADLREAVLMRANLQEANLQEADLQEAVLREAVLLGANLYRANLMGANLMEANLQAANLHDANLHETNLYRANLSWANLRDANLRGADFWGANLMEANLQGANLQGANLQGANLRGADLQGANLRGADLSNAVGLISMQLRPAMIDLNTILPDYLQK